MDRKEIYTAIIGELESGKSVLKRKSGVYLFFKLLFFLLAVTFTVLAFDSGNAICIKATVCIAAALLSFAVYLALCVVDGRCRKGIAGLDRKIKVCERENAYLDGDFSMFGDGREYIDPGHEYSFDLDIFGPSSLFNRINRTVTREGSDRLAVKLRTLPEDKERIKGLQDAVEELASMNDWRVGYMSSERICADLERLSLIEGSDNWRCRFACSATPLIMISLTVAVFLAALSGFVSWYWFSGLFLLNFVFSVFFSKTILSAGMNVEKIHKEYSGYVELLKVIEAADFRTDDLIKIKHTLFGEDASSLAAFKELSGILNLFDQRGSAVIYFLLNGTILFDIVLARKFLAWNRRYLSHMSIWLDSIAELDALVSFGTYAFNNPANVRAEIQDVGSDTIIEAKGIFHPFLNREKAVPNDFVLPVRNIAIVTGANMAGKSTFLRTIGVSYVLAANGVPVCAEKFSFSVVSLFSSMRTTDNLSRDISYFNAELLRLGQLVRHVRSHGYTLIILDEILKGTNSKDKLEGSFIFLHEISKYNVSALIATHDLELARLGEEQSGLYSNYRFEIGLSDEITYTYKIEKGTAQNLNASYLLANMLKTI